MHQVPCVDWHDYRAGGAARSAFIKAFGDALRHFGFVRLRNHEVSERLLEEVYTSARQLFAQDEATLRRWHVAGGKGKTGYTPFRIETAVGYDKPDEKRFWHVCREEEGPNVWPEDRFAPEFRRNAERLYRLMDVQFQVLADPLEAYLGVPAGTVVSLVRGKNNSTLRIAHYPKMRGDRPASAIRAGRHKDINLLTLLPAATSSGLRCQTVAGDWVNIEAVAGELVVNSGIMLERFTNGFMPATWHEVANPDGQSVPDEDRFSLPFFGHPLARALLQVPDRFCGEGFPPPPPTVTAAEALDEVLAAIKLA